MSKVISIKRGDTYLYQATVRMPVPGRLDRWSNPVMEEVDIADWGIRSQVRNNGKLVAELDVVKRPDVGIGVYELVCEDTAIWPTNGQLRQDIQYITDAGQVLSTQTFAINCIPDVTE